MSLAQGQILQKYTFSCTLWAVEGSHDTVVKYTASFFFPTEDYEKFKLDTCNYNPSNLFAYTRLA